MNTKRTDPSWSILTDRTGRYQTAASTDIRKTFERYTQPKAQNVKPMRRAK